MRYKIGDIARLFNLSTESIRHYERQGLIHPQKAEGSSYRYYQAWDMAVLTSCMPPLCRAALEHHRLLDCFEAVYTTAELGIEKRDPALYCLAAERSGVPPQSCLLFEDSPSYCAAARQEE